MTKYTVSFSLHSDEVKVIDAPPMLEDESCEYMFEPTMSCLVARSCQSCLQTSGCAISGSGYCMNASDSSRTGDDYRLASQYNLVLPDAKTTNATGIATQQAWSFPAFEAKYCAADDATCALCKQSNFWWSSSADTRFCVGLEGCVCIMACEVGHSSFCQKTTPSPATSIDQARTSSPYNQLLILVLPCMVIVGLLYKYASKRPARTTREQVLQRHLEAHSEQQQAPRRPRLGLRLMSLSAWKKDRGDAADLRLSSTAPPMATPTKQPEPIMHC